MELNSVHIRILQAIKNKKWKHKTLKQWHAMFQIDYLHQ